MTAQFKILTGMKAWYRKEKDPVPNPFFKKSKTEVLANFEYAKQIYSDIFNYQVIPAWCEMQAHERGIVCPNQIIQAIKDGTIPPFPNYQELKEFKI